MWRHTHTDLEKVHALFLEPDGAESYTPFYVVRINFYLEKRESAS